MKMLFRPTIQTLWRTANYRKTTNIFRVISGKKYSNDSKELGKVTHTGQVFEPNDYRNVRFGNAARYVNENWGVNLITEIPPKECEQRVICCDGGDPHLGHPKVYINLDKPGPHSCGYCGLRFIRKEHHH